MPGKKIILDSNFLMLPYSERIDIFSEIERLVPEKHMLHIIKGTPRELKGIIDKKNTKGQDRVAARLALKFIEAKDIKPLGSDGFVDKEIEKEASKDPKSTIVCTNDKELKKKLSESGVMVITMHGRNHLDFCRIY